MNLKGQIVITGQYRFLFKSKKVMNAKFYNELENVWMKVNEI